MFVEFAYEADLKKFAELPEIPKFGEEDMLYMTKDAYVKMKAKEKGIDESEINKGGQARKGAGKFNAFREMARMKAGQAPALAKIPAEVDIVGKPVAFDGSKKRSREDDGDDKDGKKRRDELTFEYKGVTLEVDPVSGKVLDPSKVPFTENSAIKFHAPGEGDDWKALKQTIIDTGFASPFMAFPPGTKTGSLSKAEGGEITDEELSTLASANITYGDAPVTFERMNGE